MGIVIDDDPVGVTLHKAAKGQPIWVQQSGIKPLASSYVDSYKRLWIKNICPDFDFRHVDGTNATSIQIPGSN